MHWKNAVKELIPTSQVDDPNIVTLVVGGKDKSQPFFLHKTLLQLSSVGFKALLSQNQNSYRLPGLTPNIFEEIVKHIYAFSEWEFNGSLVEACSLLKAALDFELEEFTHIIHKTISKLPLEDILACDTACFVYDVLRTTSFVDKGKLKNVVLSYICRNAKLILILDSFLKLSLDGLLEILRRDDLLVDSELDVFKAVISWGMKTLEKNMKCCSPENLQDALREPLKCVRFSNMSKFESQYYVQRMGFLPAKQWIFSSEVSNNGEKIRPEPGSSEASVEKPRKYSQSAGNSNSDLEPSMVDILQAELYVSKFKFKVEASVWKSKLSELKQQTSKKEDLQEATIIKLQEETMEFRKVAVFECEWRSFMRDTMSSSLDYNDSVKILIQNNTYFSLQLSSRDESASYNDMPQNIGASTRGQFSIRKQISIPKTVIFSYNTSESIYNLIVGVETDTQVDEFVLQFSSRIISISETLNSDVSDVSDISDMIDDPATYDESLSEFWEDQVLESNNGLVATKKWPSLLPDVTIRAKMTGRVLKILIFQY